MITALAPKGTGTQQTDCFLSIVKWLDTIFNSYAYPYTVSMGYGDLEFEREHGAKNGELVLYIDSDAVTNEKAAEILMKTKELMDRSGISFYSVQFCLWHARSMVLTASGGAGCARLVSSRPVTACVSVCDPPPHPTWHQYLSCFCLQMS